MDLCEHPWPYLAEMFECKSVENKNAKLLCLLCQPKAKELSSSVSSLSNLRKHVQVRAWSLCITQGPIFKFKKRQHSTFQFDHLHTHHCVCEALNY